MSLTLTDAKRNILSLLYEDPSHGYALAKELGVQGSTMYEHLEQLDEAGYVESYEDGRRIMYELTKKGKLTVEAEQTQGE
jgi:DNA-binding PadR family transcriptional regulator